MKVSKEQFKKKAKGFMGEALKIIFILACCAGLGIFFAVGSRAGSAERFAEEYFSNYVTNNYEEMYSMIDCVESEFINYDNFKIKCEGEKIYGSINGYKLSSPVVEGDTVTYVVTYYVGANKTANTYTITLHKQKKKTHLFFNTWKVSVNRFLINDYEIKVPVGTAVNMDGIDIAKYKVGTTEDGTLDTYVIDTIFTGDHTVSVNLDATGEITKTQYVTSDKDSLTITTNDFAIKPDVRQKLYEYSAYIVKTMYEYSMDKSRNFEDIGILYAGTEEAQASARATFDMLTGAVAQPNGAYLSELDIKTLSPEIESFTYPDKVTVRVDYTYSYKAVSGTSTLSGIVEEYTGEGNATSYVYLNLIDSSWKIVKVDMSCVDYSKKE